MHIALIANGTVQNYTQMRKKLKHCDEIFAVDGGLQHCVAMNLAPSLILGDFDSCPRSLLTEHTNIPQKAFPTNKDDSDLELAIKEALSRGASYITVVGGLHGERTDHSLSNLLLLSRYADLLSLVSEHERLFVVRNSQCFPVQQDQTLSLIPLNGPVRNVSSQGLFWELHHHTLDKNFFSLSNKTTGHEVHIIFSNKQQMDGDLLCIIQEV